MAGKRRQERRRRRQLHDFLQHTTSNIQRGASNNYFIQIQNNHLTCLGNSIIQECLYLLDGCLIFQEDEKVKSSWLGQRRSEMAAKRRQEEEGGSYRVDKW